METFENVKNQVGACGIWCGSCAVGNGSLRQLTRRYQDVLDDYGVAHWAPPELNWEAFSRGLAIVDEMASCPGCRKGGGRDDCEMRACAAGKRLSECNVCHEHQSCSHAEILAHMRTGALKAGLFVEANAGEAQALIERWTEELHTRWPSCVLFREDTLSEA